MAADSNGPSLFEVDLSAHQYHAQVHLTRSIAEDSPQMEFHSEGNTMHFSVLSNTIIRLNSCQFKLRFLALILAFVQNKGTKEVAICCEEITYLTYFRDAKIYLKKKSSCFFRLFLSHDCALLFNTRL